MAKVRYDVRNAEAQSFEVPKPGVYEAAIRECTHGESSNGNEMLTVVFEITKGDYKNSRIWHYILTDGTQDWRLREFTDALGLKPRGEFEPKDLQGSVVQVRTAIDPARDGYDEKARIKNVLASSNGASAAAASDDEDDEDAPYEEWDLADLKEEVAERGLKVTGARQTKRKLVDLLEADDEAASEEQDVDEEAEEPEDDEEELTQDDLDGMSRTELKALIKEEELEIRVTRGKSDDDLRTAIAEALEIGTDEEGAEDEDEEEEDTTPYSEWEISELKDELKERGLKTDGRKSMLVKRLEKDDATDGDPF
jgi:hypothetical protein